MIANTLQAVNMRQILKIALGIAISASIAFGLISASSQAQSGDDSAAANTLRVSPVRSDISADPGEAKTVKVTVTNPSNNKVTVRVIQNDFVAGDEDGTPAIILEEDEYAPSHSLKRFMVPVDNVELNAGESRTIDVELRIPEDAEPGGYFGAVRFAPADPDTGGQVNASASVASLVLLRVNGDAPEKLDLAEFSIRQDERVKSFMTDGENVVATVRFENKGRVQAGPFGMVSVTKGDDIVYEADFNNKDFRDMVLPDSARRWEIPLEGVGSFGRYTVSATFTYGSNNQTIEVSESFWMVPVPVIIGGVVALLVVIGLIVLLAMKIRGRSAPRKFSSQRR